MPNFDKKYPVKSKLNHLGITLGLAHVCLNFLQVRIGVSVYFSWIEFKRKITFVSSASCYKWFNDVQVQKKGDQGETLWQLEEACL